MLINYDKLINAVLYASLPKPIDKDYSYLIIKLALLAQFARIVIAEYVNETCNRLLASIEPLYHLKDCTYLYIDSRNITLNKKASRRVVRLPLIQTEISSS